MDPRHIRELQLTSPEAVWLFLLTIKVKGNPDLCLVNNNEPVVSNGVTYQPFPFALNLPADTGESQPKVTLTISNISDEIIKAIRSQVEPPVLQVQMVSSAFPDIVEKDLDFLQLRNVSYDAISITGTLEVINVLSRGFPSEQYDPVKFPGLFR